MAPRRSVDRGEQSRAWRTGVVVCAVAAAMWCGLVTAVATSGESRTESTRPPGIKAQYQRPAAIPYPGGNERTADREHLGRALFFDPRLSASGSTSCATCHHPGLSWSDGLSVARGAQMRPLERRTPTILNLAWAPALFWDGRADTLEDQALAPIQSEREMNLPLDQLIARLQGIRGYRDLFARAYPGEPLAAPAVAKAIATFERGIVSAQAPFDRWIAGEPRAISPAAERGFVLFTGKARCSTCHTGWRFTDDGFYDIGIAADDVGRGKVVPQIPLAHFAFKTPTLRNVAERAPYLHNGSASTLAEVIDLYDRGGVTHRPSLSPEIKPLALTAPEKKDLVAFLESLTSVDQEVRVPALPR